MSRRRTSRETCNYNKIAALEATSASVDGTGANLVLSLSSSSKTSDGLDGGGGGVVEVEGVGAEVLTELLTAGGGGGLVKPLKQGSETSPGVQLPSHVATPSSPVCPTDRHWLH